MTGALVVYSAIFMRYALAIQPRNYLLFGCHFINEGAQLTQGYRYLRYWKYVIILLSPSVGLHSIYIYKYLGMGFWMWVIWLTRFVLSNSWGGREKQLAGTELDKGTEKAKDEVSK
jgi:hypothetical protein